MILTAAHRAHCAGYLSFMKSPHGNGNMGEAHLEESYDVMVPIWGWQSSEMRK